MSKIITTGAISGSKKTYVENQVPLREISLTNGESFFVYDTSGIYTDANWTVDINKGAKDIRSQWILDRGDVEQIQGREVKPEDNGITGSFKNASQEFDRTNGLRKSGVEMSVSR